MEGKGKDNLLVNKEEGVQYQKLTMLSSIPDNVHKDHRGKRIIN